jgi:hypothetical protein
MQATLTPAELTEYLNAKAKYKHLQIELAAIEARTGLYLADENVDRENVMLDDTAAGYWQRMISAAHNAAGMRAEEAGQSINDLLGRSVY